MNEEHVLGRFELLAMRVVTIETIGAAVCEFNRSDPGPYGQIIGDGATLTIPLDTARSLELFGDYEIVLRHVEKVTP